MVDGSHESEPRSFARATPPSLGGGPSAGSDVVNALLLRAVLVTLIVVLLVTGWLVYIVAVPAAMPRTETERQVMKLEGLSKTQPKNAAVWADWASALVEAGEYGRAAQVIEQGAQEASESAPIFVVKATMLDRQGRSSEALALITKVIRDINKSIDDSRAKLAARGTSMPRAELAPPYLIDALILRGDILVKEKRVAEAVRAYTEALELNSNMADVQVVRGNAYASLGKTKEARSDYDAALAMIPGFKPALEGIARLEGAAYK